MPATDENALQNDLNLLECIHDMNNGKYPGTLKELASLPRQRLMYGEWLPGMCSDCQTLEDVHRYTDCTGRMKQTVYLCDGCVAKMPPGVAAKFRREWEPGEK